MILNSFKIVVIFNITSADFVLISADVVLKINHNFERNEDRGLYICMIMSKSKYPQPRYYFLHS